MKKILMGEREWGGYGSAVAQTSKYESKAFASNCLSSIMRSSFPSIEISIVRHWQMKKLFYNTKSGLMVFGFCPAGSISSVDS